jgi:cytochrome c5
MKKVYILAVVIAFVSCTASKLAVPTQADADGAQQSFPGASLADLTKGQALYNENCGLCHKLHAPKDFEVNAWHNIVPNMVQEVNKNQMKLNENDERLILMYVTSVRN